MKKNFANLKEKQIIIVKVKKILKQKIQDQLDCASLLLLKELNKDAFQKPK